MKEKRIITYIKNGQKITKEFKIFTKNAIIGDLFVSPYPQPLNYELLQIKDDIEYLKLQNINFKKEVRFIIPNNTNLIIENCSFNSSRLDLTGGNITLLNCTFNPCNYTNRIYLNNVNKLIFNLDNGKSYLTITGKSKEIDVSGNYRFDTLSITGEKAIIKNMSDIKNLKLINKETLLKDCDFEINLNNDIQSIQTQKLTLDNSKLFYQSDFDNVLINLYEEEKINKIIDRNIIFQITNLELNNNSIIDSNNEIIINNKNIDITVNNNQKELIKFLKESKEKILINQETKNNIKIKKKIIG